MAEKEYIFGSIRFTYNEKMFFDFRPEGKMDKDLETANYLMSLCRAICGKEKDNG